MTFKILIMGLPGAGKTTLAKTLAPWIGAVHWNADEARHYTEASFDFSRDARLKQAERMSWLCDTVIKSGKHAVADFVCPLIDCRLIFKADFTVWVDRINEGRFADTNAMFEPPTEFDVRVTEGESPSYWANHIVQKLVSLNAERKRNHV